MKKKLKKLSVIESSNSHLDYKGLYYYDKQIDPAIIVLREYVETQADFDPENDPEVIFNVLEWVNAQWLHDGMNDPGSHTTSIEILKRAHEGEKFRCVEYGKVTSDILSSYGITSRMVGLRSVDFAYGGVGKGHVATEVWSNRLKKWIFIDPQYSAHFRYDHIPQNYYDLYEFYKKDQFDQLELVVNQSAIDRSKKTPEDYKNDYIKFLKNYFGYVQTKVKTDQMEYSVCLKLDGTVDALTFQGLELNDIVYTNDHSELYFPINQTVVTFEYKDKVNFMEVIKTHKITTQEQYLEHLHLMAPRPDFRVKCYHNTPNHEYFEYSFDSIKWEKLSGNTFNWLLDDGVHDVYTRSVNSQGLRGVINSMKIEYK